MQNLSRAGQQNLYTLSYDVFGFLTQYGHAVVTDGMRNHDKGIVWHAGDLGHDLGGFFESVGDNGGGRDTSFFGGDGVVQTARRTAPSITDCGNEHVALFGGDEDLCRRRAARIGFA